MLEDFGGIYSLLNRQSPAGSPCFSGPGPTASSPGASLEPRGGPCFANMMMEDDVYPGLGEYVQ